MLAQRFALLLGKPLAVLGSKSGLKLIDCRLQNFLAEFCGYRWIIRIGFIGNIVPLLSKITLHLRKCRSAVADLAMILILDRNVAGVTNGRGDTAALIGFQRCDRVVGIRDLIIETADAARGGGGGFNAGFARSKPEAFGR